MEESATSLAMRYPARIVVSTAGTCWVWVVWVSGVSWWGWKSMPAQVELCRNKKEMRHVVRSSVYTY